MDETERLKWGQEIGRVERAVAAEEMKSCQRMVTDLGAKGDVCLFTVKSGMK